MIKPVLIANLLLEEQLKISEQLISVDLWWAYRTIQNATCSLHENI